MSYKLGSLFDGSGGFPLAGALCGIEPVWASEVEPYPIAVTKSRFPNMKHLGDISKINGAEIEPVDIITFGSPCQDLSVAGKRAGLKHEANGDEETTRSGLFIEAVRIIKEMRNATNGEYPRYAIWENVPGAFSSNKGEDFRVVLEELIKVVEPMAVMPEVPQKGWNYADCYTGDGWSLAYRVLDAQYWGVPQRRRRIYLVTDFRGECAKEILFERKGLRGYFTQGRTPWQNTSSYVEGSTRATDRERKVISIDRETYNCGYAFDRDPNISESGINPTLKSVGPDAVAYGLDRASFNQGQNAKYDFQIEEELQPTLTARGPGAVSDPDYVIRRLTPTECARLQGFADKWGEIDTYTDFTEEQYKFWLEVRKTHDAINGRAEKDYTKAQMLTWYNKLQTDSSEYKMWGNGIALPTALYVMQGVAEALSWSEFEV